MVSKASPFSDSAPLRVFPSRHLQAALFIAGCLAEQDLIPVRQQSANTHDLDMDEYAVAVRLIASCLVAYGVEIPDGAGLPFNW